MLDRIGLTVNVGDQVIYTTGAQSNTYLDIGTVTSLTVDRRQQPCCVIKGATGRTLSNVRRAHELLCLAPIYTVYPELQI